MKGWKLTVGITLLLVAGGLVGSIGTQLYHKHWAERFRKEPAQRTAAILKHLTRELGLSATQQRKFEVMIREVEEKRREIFKKSHAEADDLINRSFERMKEELDPGQQKRLGELRARHDRDRKEKRKHSIPYNP